MALFWNCLFAPLLLREVMNAWDVLACVSILAGASLSVWYTHGAGGGGEAGSAPSSSGLDAAHILALWFPSEGHSATWAMAVTAGFVGFWVWCEVLVGCFTYPWAARVNKDDGVIARVFAAGSSRLLRVYHPLVLIGWSGFCSAASVCAAKTLSGYADHVRRDIDHVPGMIVPGAGDLRGTRTASIGGDASSAAATGGGRSAAAASAFSAASAAATTSTSLLQTHEHTKTFFSSFLEDVAVGALQGAALPSKQVLPSKNRKTEISNLAADLAADPFGGPPPPNSGAVQTNALEVSGPEPGGAPAASSTASPDQAAGVGAIGHKSRGTVRDASFLSGLLHILFADRRQLSVVAFPLAIIAICGTAHICVGMFLLSKYRALVVVRF